LSEVKVSIPTTNKGDNTNLQGEFDILFLPVGNYELLITKVGYTSKIVKVDILPNKSATIIVELFEQPVHTDEVSVSTFRYENNVQKPFSTFSFSKDEILSNPGSQGDIFRAIGMLPGVTSSGGIYSAIAVRGQGVRDNVYMVDDIPMTEVGHLEGNSFFNDPNGGRFSIFAPKVIENAVFQGGAFGAEFGRRSASYLGLSIREGNLNNPIIDGQIDLLGLTVNYEGPSYIDSNTSLFLSARYQNFYPLVHIVGLKQLGLPIYGDLILKTKTKLNPSNSLSILAMYCPESFYRDIDNVIADKELNLLYLPDFQRSKMTLGVNLHSNLGEQTILKNILYFSHYDSKVVVGKTYPSLDSNGVFFVDKDTHRKTVQNQMYSESKIGYRALLETTLFQTDRLLIGLEIEANDIFNERKLLALDTNFIFRRNQLSDPNLNYQVITPSLLNTSFDDYALNASGYISYYGSITQNLSYNLGLRMDHNGFSNQIVIAPRGNMIFHFDPNNSLSFGMGTYFQDPVLLDIADIPNGNSLLFEKNNQFILSYTSYFQDDMKFMIEGWYKEFSNMITTPISGSILRNNAGTGIGSGFDISVTKRLNNFWHGMLSYSYMDVKRNDNDQLGDYPFTFSQPHQVNIMISYKVNENISFSCKYRYATGRPTDDYRIFSNVLGSSQMAYYGMELIGRNQNRLPDFSSLDIRVNYTFRVGGVSCRAFVDIVNVLNRQIANNMNFNHLTGISYFDGIAIFPSGGFQFEM
jgi:CarboxypepD_reg-like domain/TonB-dependent Receptor Plug Domain